MAIELPSITSLAHAVLGIPVYCFDCYQSNLLKSMAIGYELLYGNFNAGEEHLAKMCLPYESIPMNSEVNRRIKTWIAKVDSHYLVWVPMCSKCHNRRMGNPYDVFVYLSDVPQHL